MFKFFKRKKSLEQRVTELELEVRTLQVDLNKTKQQLSDSSVAIKGIYELLKNVITIGSRH